MPAEMPSQNSTDPHDSKSDRQQRRRGKNRVDGRVARPLVTCSRLLLALALPACGGEPTPTTSSASGAPAASSAAPATSGAHAAARVATTVEKVSMNGISWEVTMPADLHKPQYPVTNPEYLGDGDATLALSNRFPKFSSVDSYIERNIATKVLEKKQIGEAHFVIYESQKAGGFSMVAIVPNDTIGWKCSGEMTRAAELRAMCESVVYKKD
jgi:hypothetical protein